MSSSGGGATGGRRSALEIHKFGGASLADTAAFRHAVDIVRRRSGSRVVVCSAPSGVTDVLLGMAKRARGGQEMGRDIAGRRSVLGPNRARPRQAGEQRQA